MTEYRCHWWPAGAAPVLTPNVRVDAESARHGAAVALRQFLPLGCDITAPHAHVDATEADGSTHMILVEEVLDWLAQPAQAPFVERERLEDVLRAAVE